MRWWLMTEKTNGKLQITIGATLLLAALAAAFTLGGHLLNEGIHEDSVTKTLRVERAVDRSIDREIKPMFRDIQRQLDSLTQKVDELQQEE